MSSAPSQDPRPPGHVRLHHVGFVLPSIQESAEPLALSLGACWDGNIIFDPLQKVRVSFLLGPDGSQVELVEPGDPASPVTQFLERGGGLHHLCYEVDNLEAHLAFCRAVGTKIIRPPMPAVAFGGRHIAWALTKRRLLLEFLENPVRLTSD